MSIPTAQESAAFLAHAYTAAKDAIIGIDSSGLITHFNPGASRLFRIAEPQAIGDRFENMLIEPQRESFRKVLARLFEKGEKKLDRTMVEVTVLRSQASNIRCEVYLTSFTVQDKIFVCGFVKDVTERKKAAQRLYEAQKIEILDKFAGEVAHDINNLLVGIQGHATLIKLADSEQDRNYSVGEIDQLVKKGAEVIRELRAFARAGGTRENQSPRALVNFNHCVKNVYQLLGRTLSRKIDVRLSLADGLPSVNGVSDQIEQAITAVCMNAQDAMPHGGTLTLETSTFKAEDHYVQTHPGMPQGNLVKLTVRDTGVGMKPEVLRRAYEPFFTTRESEGHSGLGLTMAYKAAKEHGGYIGIDSEPDKGTTVQMYFPAVGSSALVELVTDEKVIPGTGTLLLIDDEPAVLETTSKLLKGLGYKVHTATSGEEGMKIYEVRQGEIDLVIVDMKMPGKNGLETFQEIKKTNPEVKAILTTGYAVRGDTDAMFRLGLRAYILKPYTLAELSTKISNILNPPPVETPAPEGAPAP